MSITEKLYLQIKQDIRDNRLAIGVALRQEELSARYKVSRIPVRDVMQRLKNEGWLRGIGKVGLMIPPLEAQEAEDLSLMRVYLEPLLLGFALPKLSNQAMGQAEDILQTLDRPGLSVAEHGELNWQFHACLYLPAERPTLFTTVANLHQQCGKYIGFHSVTLNYTEVSQQQHYQLLDAVKKRDTARAKRILVQHIQEASDILVAHLHSVTS
ncbi:MAG: GntR family transcriptional regulator [Paraglaciecola sp.]|nr:GntR family transcriptional regulator [Paraglaciecola sp.]NCT48392.1 GntR family transcriptional regulator [Paraglaciecola sp.]